jgi:hypothetical protein
MQAMILVGACGSRDELDWKIMYGLFSNAVKRADD